MDRAAVRRLLVLMLYALAVPGDDEVRSFLPALRRLLHPK
jgi:hypothetical protein